MNSVIFCYVDTKVCWASVHCMRTFRDPSMICVCNGSIYEPILWGHNACYKEPDACTEDQSYGIVHVGSYITYARSQVRSLYQVCRTSYMGTHHALEVVFSQFQCNLEIQICYLDWVNGAAQCTFT